MRYLTLSELIYINGTLLNRPDIASGKQKIRDLELLEAAAARPESSVFGADAYPTLRLKVAALMHSLMRNHPFADGNKRTATVAAILMFRVNGARVVWHQPDALPVIVDAAEGRITLETLAAWFPTAPAPESHAPDAEADMRLIAAIIAEQRWLLDELDKR
jgi:death-on-curing protein